jgi:single-strand DNA-binding protein
MTVNTLTITGNLGADPELRFTPSGKAVASLKIADTPRHKNAAGDWVDGQTLWMPVSIWGREAEAVTEALRKGDRVVAVGRIGARTFTTQAGEERTVIEMTAEQIGKVTKGETRAAQPKDGWGSAGKSWSNDESPF